jgi:hypothetical protein
MASRAEVLAVEQQLQDDLDQITDTQTRALVAAWATAWSEVSAELLDTLAGIMADGTRVTAATIVRVPRLAQELAGIADRLDELATSAGITITRDLGDVVARAADGQIGLMLAQLGEDDPRVGRMARRTPSAALRALVDRFTSRVTAQTLPLADQTYEVIQRELVRGVAVGSNPRATARRMVARAEDHFNFGLTRALTISRTETLDAHREAARVEQDRHADVLAGWLWLAHLSPRTCRSCLAMNGRLFPLEVAGPHDHQQGRCSRCPVVKGADGTEPDLSWVPDADAYFEALPEADQRAILGRQGYQAWASGVFPREQWTKTRSADGWRNSQVPAAPGDSDGGSGIPALPAPGGRADDQSHRDRAIAALGDPPADASTADGKSYWARRQSMLPVDFHGDTLLGHEVESLERFLDAGEALEWIPKDRSRPTNDFRWTSLAGQPEIELKSTLARFETIHGTLVKAMSRAMINHGFTKENFLIDLGEEPLTLELARRLAGFNVGRRKYRLARLWVIAEGVIHEVNLRK